MRGFFSFERLLEYFPIILRGFPYTLNIVLVATVAGVLLGTVLAFIRIYKIPLLNQAVQVYVSFIRGTPMIVQLFIVMYGLPVLVQNITGINIARWDTMFFVLVTYSLNESAFLSEHIRAAIQSVPEGQAEAGYSVGLNGTQTFFRIVMPQAFRVALPGLGSNFVYLFQGTSLAFLVGVVDIMGSVNTIGTRTSHYIEGYTVAAIIFVTISFVLERVFLRINKKLNYGSGM